MIRPSKFQLVCVLCGLLASVVLAALLGISPQTSVGAPTASDKSGDHARYESILHKTFSGHVEVYFDVTEVESQKPRLSDLKFVELVDITGKHLMRFSDAKGGQWLIDPDTVLTYHIK